MFKVSQLTKLFGNAKNTIFNLATGSERSSVSVIRISGPNAFRALSYLLSASSLPNANGPENPKDSLKIHKISHSKMTLRNIYGHGSPLKSSESQTNENQLRFQGVEGTKRTFDVFSLKPKELLDKALIVCFEAPRSFTGEDTIELHCHGSRAIQKKVISSLGLLENFRVSEPVSF